MPVKKEKTIVIGEDVTFHRLCKWYKMEFEKLGWMVLAKKSGNTEKAAVYIHSLTHLKHAFERKLGNIKDADKKEDIKIMLTNLNVLIEHAKKDFA